MHCSLLLSPSVLAAGLFLQPRQVNLPLIANDIAARDAGVRPGVIEGHQRAEGHHPLRVRSVSIAL